jgi:hypothetical protein
MSSYVLNYDFETLPKPPFTVFFYNRAGEISPKQAYTVLRKSINEQEHKIELFIMELGQNVDYHPKLMSMVNAYFNVN